MIADYRLPLRDINVPTNSQHGRWLKDFEADERAELPKDMQRGVLSEDGLDNLLREVADLHSRMRNLIAESNR